MELQHVQDFLKGPKFNAKYDEIQRLGFERADRVGVPRSTAYTANPYEASAREVAKRVVKAYRNRETEE
jgi:hypothetical protein